MGADVLSTRDIQGMFYHALAGMAGDPMALRLGMVFDSDQPSETYKWLGMVPQLRAWEGGRVATYLRDFGLTIENVHYEASVPFAIRDLRRDKTGQIERRIAEMAERANLHWNKLVSDLIAAGESTMCYDGQYFFDTDHVEGNSGSQSNDLSIDISAAPAETHGTATAPSVEEAAHVINKLIEAILGFKDDQGEPVNENARTFEIVTPPSLWTPFNNAATMGVYPQGGSNRVTQGGMDVRVTMDARSSWTTKVAGFRTDGTAARPFILQEDGGVETKMLGEGSDHAFNHDEHVFGVDAWRGAGYGMWSHACLATMTT